MFRLVLFDIDGTLIETGGAGVQAFARACAMEFNVPNGNQGLRFAGCTDTGIVREFFRRNQIQPSPDKFQRFFECYVFWLDHLLEKKTGRVLPGVLHLIAQLQGCDNPPALGLLTGNIRLGAQIKLSHFRLWDYFQTGAFGDDAEDRDQIAAIARDRGAALLAEDLRVDEILVIGDTPLDIQCARAIKAPILAVATGSYRVEQLKSYSPEWLVEDLKQVKLSAFGFTSSITRRKEADLA